MKSERESVQLTEKAWAEAVARTWLGDQAFRQQLLSDPKSMLRSMGATIPDHVTVRIVENTPTEMTFVLPLKPRTLEQIDVGDVLELYGGSCPCTVCAVPNRKP